MGLESWRHFRTNFGRVGHDATDSGSGLVMGDFGGQKVSLWPFLRLETRSLRPPLPPEVSRCLARIMGESYDSGHGLGSDGSRNNGISSVCSRTNSGKSRNPLPERTIGLKMGDFPLSLFCPRDRSCDAKCLKRTPLLLMGRISVR